TGDSGPPPKHTEDYRRGYLTGIIRGDAHLGAYHYDRVGRTHGDVYRFRLALCDLEALDRAASFLEQSGIDTTRFLFTPTTDRRTEAWAIRASKKAAIE